MIHNKIVLSAGSLILLFSLLVEMVGCSSPTANSAVSTQSEVVSSSVFSAESETETSSQPSASTAVSSSTVSKTVSSSVVSKTASNHTAPKAAVSSTAPKTVNTWRPSVSSSVPSPSKPSSSAVTSSASSNAASYTDQDLINYKNNLNMCAMQIDDALHNPRFDMTSLFHMDEGIKTEAMAFFNKLEEAFLKFEQIPAPKPYEKAQASFKQGCEKVIYSLELDKKLVNSIAKSGITDAQCKDLNADEALFNDGLDAIDQTAADYGLVTN